MGKVVVVGDRYTTSAFAVLGAEDMVLEDPYKLLETLNSIRRREDVDLVLVSRDLYEPVRESVDSLLLNLSKPVVTVIPTPFSQGTPLDVKKIIFKALGFG
ncbi:ATP synthase subunit F [Sulfodiicoccus acidiphilus]|uniref:ATP synthase subunit F n=1 Tax=Sulfodiicoccus acidiphilus TaxID=1670455 RepID=A0A348B0S7_9CREN|nr:V-type ATP synthase subunit F [Sulfodiicoccus acidiphilus]BBD71779.1 ATP synthase subunit F [Sulfodiicoccus acidiphilus]GGT99152.1 ATP synthase subunit F [Sulfodiicoccus acidiphilus]